MTRATATWTNTVVEDFQGSSFPDSLAFKENLLQNVEYLYQKGRIQVTYIFALDNVPGTTTTAMNLAQPSTGTTVSYGANVEIKALKAGSFVGLALVSNAARSAGTATARFRRNGSTVGTDLSVTLDATNTTDCASVQQAGIDTFAAGDTIGMAVVSSSWAPITADMLGYLTVAYDV